MFFDKMQGLGNDFVLINIEQSDVPYNSNFVKLLCDRKFGVGCDTAVFYDAYKDEEFARAFFFNADGSEAEICGNAARCLGLLLHDRGYFENFVLESAERKYAVSCLENAVAVNMGIPSLQQKDVGISEKIQCDMLNIGASLQRYSDDFAHADAACVSIGNPHIVFFSEVQDLEKCGTVLNNREFFKNGINVSVAHVESREKISLRVFERGVGLTSACGSGACATAYLAYKRNMVERELVVEQQGGDLEILINDDGSVTQIGSAHYIFSGEIRYEKSDGLYRWILPW